MRVLLAIDDSPFSEAATRELASQVHAKGTAVLVVRVLEPIVRTTIPRMEPAYATELAGLMEEERKQARESLEKAATTLRREGFQVEARIAEEEVRAAILDIASEWQADLIVVGSHGRKGLNTFLLGSVAESVARHAKCSVWIVRASQRG